MNNNFVQNFNIYVKEGDIKGNNLERQFEWYFFMVIFYVVFYGLLIFNMCKEVIMNIDQ